MSKKELEKKCTECVILCVCACVCVCMGVGVCVCVCVGGGHTTRAHREVAKTWL